VGGGLVKGGHAIKKLVHHLQKSFGLPEVATASVNGDFATWLLIKVSQVRDIFVFEWHRH
jgi:hypothetical protein